MKIICAVFLSNFLQYVSSDDFYSKKVILSVGGVEVKFEDRKAAEYDGVYEYLYEEGEGFDLTCKNIQGTGGLKLGYYDAYGTKVVETDILEGSTELLNLRLLMKADYNKSYVDCTYFPLDFRIGHKQEYTYRIVFRKQNSLSAFIVTIDGVKLPYRDSEYHYKFIYGETLNVSCEKRNKKIPGDIIMGINTSESMQRQANESKEHVNTQVIENNQAKYVFLLDTKYMDDGIFECSSGALGSQDYISAKVHFYGESHDPVIRGLSPSNIIYEYSKNNDEWVTHYQYSLNETLPLSCSTVKRSTLHRFTEDDPPTDSQRHSYGYTYVSRTFTLNADHNGTNITCEARETSEGQKTQRKVGTLDEEHKTQRMVVILHLKPSISDLDGDDDRSTLYLILGCVVGVLFLGVSTVCGYCWCKRNKKDDKEEPYESFNEDNNPITPPNQWDENEYTYIKNENNYVDKSVILENELYRRNKDYNASQRRITACSGLTENHYSEIDESIFRNPPNNTNYSEPYDHMVNMKRDIPGSGEGYSNIQKETDKKGYGNIEEKNVAKTNYCNMQGDDNDVSSNLTYVNNHKYSN